MSAVNVVTDEIPLPVTCRAETAPTWAWSRGEHMGRDVVSVAESAADCPREHHASVEATIAEAIVALAVSDCRLFLKGQRGRRSVESAISAAGFFGSRAGRVMVESLTGTRGLDLALDLAHRVKAAVMESHRDVLINMGHVPPPAAFQPNEKVCIKTDRPTPLWDWLLLKQPDLFKEAAA